MVYYGLLLFFILEYVRPGSYVPALDVLHLNSIVPFAVLIGSLFTTEVKVPDVLGSRNARWIMFLLFLMVISIPISDVKLYAVDKFTAVFGYFLIFVAIKKEVYDLDRMKGVLTILILVHLVIGALSPEMFSGDGERHLIASGSFLGDGNDFALSVNIAIPFCLFLLSESQGVTKKLFYSGALIILVIEVVSTQSRGGMLALTAMGLYYLLKSERKMLGASIIMLLVVLITAVAPDQFYQRMETMTKTGDEMEGSAQGRVYAWKSAIRMAADHPLLGVGAGHFPVKYGAEYRPEGVEGIPWQTAHSSYFLILGELGIPGITFLMGIIIANFISNRRTLQEMRTRTTARDVTCRNLMVALNASLIAFAVGGAFLSAAYYPHMYFLAALLECGRDLTRKTIVAESALCESGEDVSSGYRGVMETQPWSKA